MNAQLDSISLPAQNAERLCRFYTEVFGLKENKERSHPPGFFMLNGGRGCNLLIMDAKGSHTETGIKGFELGMETDSLERLAEKVTACGGTIVQSTQQMQWERRSSWQTRRGIISMLMFSTGKDIDVVI